MNPLLILLLGMVVVLGGVLVARLHAFLALILGALVVSALTPLDPGQVTFLDRVTEGFGETCGKIGILIAAAAIIGKALLDSGAAERIVISALATFGQRRSPEALSMGSFLVGIPVFFDTVFYLMIPLAKALARRTNHDYLLYVLSIVAGATMAHSLVPPTPGPLFVATELAVPVGTMMVAGLVVGLITVNCGLLYARFANRRWPIPLREEVGGGEGESASDPDRRLPPLGLSIAPIVAPILMIAGVSFWDGATTEPLPVWAEIVGDKTFALLVTALFSLWLLAKYSKWAAKELKHPVQDALFSAGSIILVTAAGGAFGAALRATGIADMLSDATPAATLWLLPIAFFITTFVRIAQGSATVAMMTSVAVVAPVAGEGLAFHPVYLALAIGCGSKPIPWMNDSGFWIISRMAGTTEAETLKTASVMMSLMGFVGLAVLWVAAAIFPMAPELAGMPEPIEALEAPAALVSP